MVTMYILVTILVIATLWALAENDKLHQVPAQPQSQQDQQDQPTLDPWQRVQKRLDRGCGTAVLPDIVVDGEVKESILAVNDKGPFIFMRTPGRPWVEIAHEDDIATADIVRWAKARWKMMQ